MIPRGRLRPGPQDAGRGVMCQTGRGRGWGAGPPGKELPRGSSGCASSVEGAGEARSPLVPGQRVGSEVPAPLQRRGNSSSLVPMSVEAPAGVLAPASPAACGSALCEDGRAWARSASSGWRVSTGNRPQEGPQQFQTVSKSCKIVSRTSSYHGSVRPGSLPDPRTTASLSRDVPPAWAVR